MSEANQVRFLFLFGGLDLDVDLLPVLFDELVVVQKAEINILREGLNKFEEESLQSIIIHLDLVLLRSVVFGKSLCLRVVAHIVGGSFV